MIPAEGSVIVSLPPQRQFRLSPPAARLLARIDGVRDLRELANGEGAPVPPVTPGAIGRWIEATLVPSGLASFGPEVAPIPAATDSDAVERVVMPTDVVVGFGRALVPIAHSAVLAPAVVLAVALQGIVFSRVASTIPTALAHGWSWPLALLLWASSFVVHELGHAAALLGSGLRPGAIRVRLRRGLPLLVLDAGPMDSLTRLDRIRVDLAGVAFQLLAAGAFAMLAAGGSHAGRIALVLVDLAIIVNLAPWLSSDGAWAMRDAFGRESAAPPVPTSPLDRPARLSIARVARTLAIRVRTRWRLFRRSPDVGGLLELVPSSLTAAYGDRWSSERLRSFAKLCITDHELTRADHDELLKGGRCDRIVGGEALFQLRTARRGVVVGSLHYGPYHYVPGEIAAFGFPVQTLVHPALARLRADAWRQQSLERRIEMEALTAASPRSLIRAAHGLGEGGAVVVYFDGHTGLGPSARAGDHVVSFPFLGIPLRVRTGPAWLASHAQVPVVLAAVRRGTFGERTMVLSEPFAPPKDASPASRAAFVRDLYRWFEDRVRERPEHWSGWLWSGLLWGEMGASPTAPAEDLARERARMRQRLENGSATRLRSDPARVCPAELDGRWLIVDGTTRRVLEGDRLTCQILRAAGRGVRFRDLPRQVEGDTALVGDAAARIVLAGLARIES